MAVSRYIDGHGIHGGGLAMTPELTDIEAIRRRIGSRLRAVLPEDGVVTDEERLRPFECDALSAYRQPPLAVAMPTTVAEVQAVL